MEMKEITSKLEFVLVREVTDSSRSVNKLSDEQDFELQETIRTLQGLLRKKVHV